MSKQTPNIKPCNQNKIYNNVLDLNTNFQVSKYYSLTILIEENKVTVITRGQRSNSQHECKKTFYFETKILE